MNNGKHLSLLKSIVLFLSLALSAICDRSILDFIGFCFEDGENINVVGMVSAFSHPTPTSHFSAYVVTMENETRSCDVYGLQFFKCKVNFFLIKKYLLILNNSFTNEHEIIPLFHFQFMGSCFCSERMKVMESGDSDVIKFKLDPLKVIYGNPSLNVSLFVKNKESYEYTFLTNSSMKTQLVSSLDSNERIVTYTEVYLKRLDLCHLEPLDFLFVISGKTNCSDLLKLENVSAKIPAEQFIANHCCMYNKTGEIITYKFPIHNAHQLLSLQFYVNGKNKVQKFPSNKAKSKGKGFLFYTAPLEIFALSVSFQYCKQQKHSVNISCSIVSEESLDEVDNIAQKRLFYSPKYLWIVLVICSSILITIAFVSACILRLRNRPNNNTHEYVEEEMLRMVPHIES